MPNHGVAADGGTSANTITWIINDFPPFMIMGGPQAGHGVVDDYLTYVTARMPEYQHVRDVASVARVLALMRQGSLVCHPVMQRLAERLAIVEFSRPTIFGLAKHIVIRRENRPRLARHIGVDGTVDLHALLIDPGLIAAVSSERALPPAIADALKAAGNRPNITAANVNYQAPFRQLAAGWVDYIFAYPLEVKWYMDQEQGSGGKIALDYLPIRGNPELAAGYFGCTKGAWGSKVIERINGIMQEAGPLPPWHEEQYRFLDETASRQTREALDRLHPFSEGMEPAGSGR